MPSSTAEYALRAVLVLARHDGGRALRAEEIADAIAAPRNYLSKTLHALAREGILTSARGPRGGFLLACDPEELTVARVIDCFDGPPPLRRCLIGGTACDPANPCQSHHRWSAIIAARRTPFAQTTVASLLGTQGENP